MVPLPDLPALVGTVEEEAGGAAPLEQLARASATAAELEALGDDLVSRFVERCRDAGCSWSAISGALGVSKQAAHKRFAGAVPALDRCTPRARAALDGAADQARRLGHTFIGTEHLLAALVGSEGSPAAAVLGGAGVDLAAVEAAVASWTSSPPTPWTGELTYTPRALGACRQAVNEAVGAGCRAVGTEHLLLGLFAEPESVAARVLGDHGLHRDEAAARLAAASG